MTQKEMVIAQVVATHASWYPAHNQGRPAPEAATNVWINKLVNSNLDENHLLLLVADNKSRNLLLGKTYP
jgi:hypothetical protein